MASRPKFIKDNCTSLHFKPFLLFLHVEFGAIFLLLNCAPGLLRTLNEEIPGASQKRRRGNGLNIFAIAAAVNDLN